MAAFDDSVDPALGAACNRLAAWVEPMPEGVTVDAASGLSERDLAVILRRLHAMRHVGEDAARGAEAGEQAGASPAPPPARPPRASVPITAKRR